MTRQELEVDVHRDATGYWAQVVGIEGCLASGQTLDELTSALTEALEIYLGENGEAQRLLVQIVGLRLAVEPDHRPDPGPEQTGAPPRSRLSHRDERPSPGARPRRRD